ncbi:lantibiotic immunity ABC transporter MutE/EpiE family permease subunit [Anaeromicropila herbilytica]|uniref:Multidrug ABC transporter permease n=1 Tax=Anaeromicropila herbilytica TaxID=2785025 RepID=A0A7R7IE76_9FIRM|nr:lantibiotic immunity ABC transporter MutE/EpiE family permease subunit [Anaeromicropila herbilytica]BCN30803.1 multidrug ABC transporter permease [Anaeromicropila herbilytica]
MIQYLKAEHLKYKNTLVRRLIYLAPIITILLALSSPLCFQAEALNWWYTFLAAGCISLMCAFVQEKEVKKLKYRALFSLPISIKKIWTAKIILVCCYLFIVCMLVCVGSFSGYLIAPRSIVITFGRVMIASVVIAITSIWQIPFCLLLVKRFGLFVTIMINSMVGVMIGVLVVDKSLWYLCPYSWTTRLMCPILGILPNGLMAKANDPLLNKNGMGITLILAITLFIILTMYTSHQYSKGEVE